MGRGGEMLPSLLCQPRQPEDEFISQHLQCLSSFAVAVIKYPTRSSLRKNRFVLAHSSRDHPSQKSKHQQQLDPAGHMTSRREGVMSADAQFPPLLSIHSWTEPMKCSGRHTGWVFHPNTLISISLLWRPCSPSPH